MLLKNQKRMIKVDSLKRGEGTKKCMKKKGEAIPHTEDVCVPVAGKRL